MKLLGSYVYLLANQINGTLYLGVTSDLKKRVWEHKEGIIEGFSKKHDTSLLVWYEVHDEMEEAIKREKQIKRWKREWKIRLIREMNPEWLDLYKEL